MSVLTFVLSRSSFSFPDGCLNDHASANRVLILSLCSNNNNTMITISVGCYLISALRAFTSPAGPRSSYEYTVPISASPLSVDSRHLFHAYTLRSSSPSPRLGWPIFEIPCYYHWNCSQYCDGPICAMELQRAFSYSDAIHLLFVWFSSPKTYHCCWAPTHPSAAIPATVFRRPIVICLCTAAHLFSYPRALARARIG